MQFGNASSVWASEGCLSNFAKARPSFGNVLPTYVVFFCISKPIKPVERFRNGEGPKQTTLVVECSFFIL